MVESKKHSIISVKFPAQRLGAILILIAIFFTLFYGIVVKLTLGNETLFTLKTYAPEFFLLVGLAIIVATGSCRISASEFAFMIMMLIVVVVNVGVSSDLSQLPIAARDVLIPLFAFFLLKNTSPASGTIKLFRRGLSFLFAVFILLSFVLYLVEVNMGYEWTEKFYTGYTFWGTDPKSRIVINSNGAIMRVPGLTGHSVKCSMFALVGFIVVWLNENYIGKNFSRILMFIAAVDVVVYDNRASMVALLIIIVLTIADGRSKDSGHLNPHFGHNACWLPSSIARTERWVMPKFRIRIGYFLVLICSLTVVAAVILFASGEFADSSMGERLGYWNALLSSEVSVSLLVPLNLLNFTAKAAASSSVGVMATVWDSAYLYFAFSFGLMLLVYLVVLFVKYWLSLKNSILKSPNRISRACMYMILVLAVLGIVTNVFNGRSFMTMFSMVVPLLYAYTVNDAATGHRRASIPNGEVSLG